MDRTVNDKPKLSGIREIIVQMPRFLLRNFGDPLPCRLLVVELLQLTNNIGQLALTNRFLGGKYLLHGLTTFSSIWGDSRKRTTFLNFVLIFISMNNNKKEEHAFCWCWNLLYFQLKYP
jgi:hypothetical protein